MNFEGHRVSNSVNRGAASIAALVVILSRDLGRQSGTGTSKFSVGDSGGRAAAAAAARRRQSARARREATIYASFEPRTPRACSVHQPAGPGTDDC